MRAPGPGERGLTQRERWPHYAGGLLTETAFVLGLTLVAFAIALIATAVF